MWGLSLLGWRSPGEGNMASSVQTSMDREVLLTTVARGAKSWTRLSDFTPWGRFQSEQYHRDSVPHGNLSIHQTYWPSNMCMYNQCDWKYFFLNKKVFTLILPSVYWDISDIQYCIKFKGVKHNDSNNHRGNYHSKSAEHQFHIEEEKNIFPCDDSS